MTLVRAVGKPFEITQTEDYVEQAKEYVKRALAGETIVGEFSRPTREGDVEHHSFNIQPVKRNTKLWQLKASLMTSQNARRRKRKLGAW